VETQDTRLNENITSGLLAKYYQRSVRIAVDEMQRLVNQAQEVINRNNGMEHCVHSTAQHNMAMTVETNRKWVTLFI
jgi:hypothetical protein